MEDGTKFLDKIAHGFDGNNINNIDVEEFLNRLEKGFIRSATKNADGWVADERVKKGILSAFRLANKERVKLGPLTFIDKANLWPRAFNESDEVRIVPGGVSVRRGAYLGKSVTVMPPSYINIGAFVDDGAMIDSNALVGSCAQIGKRVHISAGAQIGGVLEPIGACPVIIEDGCLVGGSAGLYEGTVIKKGAVIGAGVVITKSTKIFDLVKEKIISAEKEGVIIPENAVVVPGSRSLNTDFAKKYGLSLSSPLIIKYRDEKTSDKLKLEESLR